jgi:hypothetical protein
MISQETVERFALEALKAFMLSSTASESWRRVVARRIE